MRIADNLPSLGETDINIVKRFRCSFDIDWSIRKFPQQGSYTCISWANGAETNCRIVHNLGILLMNSNCFAIFLSSIQVMSFKISNQTFRGRQLPQLNVWHFSTFLEAACVGLITSSLHHHQSSYWVETKIYEKKERGRLYKWYGTVNLDAPVTNQLKFGLSSKRPAYFKPSTQCKASNTTDQPVCLIIVQMNGNEKQ